ncbi:MAG: hypothetical protein H6766_05505 [Candidatus Peribacteria bacterium]|nr:MAG: hypothetical protein H6766_05505 [Candidatus Peribacteria bacterium]
MVDDDVKIDSISARIGPSASWEVYEFGPEACDIFDEKHISQREGKIYVGIADQVYDQLTHA